MKRSLYVLFSAFIVLFLAPSYLFAQTPDETVPLEESTGTTDMILIASVNLYEAKIVSQEDNTFNVSFDVVNGKGIQSGVKYAVQLVRQDENGLNIVLDQKVYSESLVLGPGQMIHKEVPYVAPEYLNGTYRLMIASKNENGLPLAFATMDEVILSGNGQYIEIPESTCYLNVAGEPAETTYSLLQGVDIAADEDLVLTCDAINHYDKDMSVDPFFGTYHRSLFGDSVNTEQVQASPVVLAAGEEKTFSVSIPKPQGSQAYDTTLVLRSEGKDVSNTIQAHYVLQGVSATIQNATFDKDTYALGDVAHISFTWTPSADIFLDSRAGEGTDIPGGVIVDMDIVDKNSVSCADTFSKVLSDESPFEILDVAIVKQNCVAAYATVKLKDSNGTVLDSLSFGSLPITEEIEVSGGGLSFKDVVTNPLFLVSMLILLGVLALFGFKYFTKKKDERVASGVSPDANNGSGTMMSLLVVTGISVLLFGFGGGRAQAESWTLPGNGGSYIVYTANLNKPTYVPNETISLTWSIGGFGCANGLGARMRVAVDQPNRDSQTELYNGYYDTGKHNKLWVNFGSGTYTGLLAPGLAGPHLVNLSLYITSDAGDDVDYWSAASAAFTVAVPVPPTQGGWSGWTDWSECNATCGGGTQTRSALLCNNPYPANGGVCPPRPVETQACNTQVCTVSLKALPTEVVKGDKSELSWLSNTKTCIASGSWSGTKAVSGTEVTEKLTDAQTYTITCYGDDAKTKNASATASVTVRPTQCSDLKDNDGDGRSNGADPGCWNNPKNSSTYNDKDDDESNEPACMNNKDDDGDGYTDAADPGCHTGPNYDPTDPATYDPTAPSEDNCGNGICEDKYGETLGTCPVDCNKYIWEQD